MERFLRLLVGLFLYGVVVPLLVVGCAVLLLGRAVDTGADGDAQYFVIEQGRSFQQIVDALAERRLIRSRLFARVVARVYRIERSVQSGSYAIPRGLTTVQLLQYLSGGNQLLISVTIPEGLTVGGVAEILERRGVVGAAEFLDAATDAAILERYGIPAQTVEGYLFPSTYRFEERESAERVITHMIDMMYMELRDIFVAADGGKSGGASGGGEGDSAGEGDGGAGESDGGAAGSATSSNSRFDALTPVDIHRLLTLSSMVEKEYLVESDAPLIASVFANRLERGMRLEACSTIVYILTELQGKPHPDRIFFVDLEIDSPYNTYRNAGLPPHPIANPGSVAIAAAVQPADTDYLFFVLETLQSTHHVFSETFTEHSRARVIYVRSRN